MVYNRLIIEGNAVYEIDDECMRKKQSKTPDRETFNSDRSQRQNKPRGSNR